MNVNCMISCLAQGKGTESESSECLQKGQEPGHSGDQLRVGGICGAMMAMAGSLKWILARQHNQLICLLQLVFLT